MSKHHPELIKALAVTAQLTNTEMTKEAKIVMVDDLSQYPLLPVLNALKRCRRELKGRLTIADVVERIDDGRPGVEQAWSMIPQNEDSSVVWTEEMATAFGAAQPLLATGDQVAARMAFKETYTKELQKAKDENRPVKWRVSFGHDPVLREDAVAQAIEKKLISPSHGLELLPYSERVLQVAGKHDQLLLGSPEDRKKIKRIAQELAGGKEENEDPLEYNEEDLLNEVVLIEKKGEIK